MALKGVFMNKSVIGLIVLVSFITTSCATMVRIDSNVKDASVSINHEKIGQTPATTKLSDFVFNSYTVSVEKEGYLPYVGPIKKEVKIVPVLFCWVYLVPLLWSYGPKPSQYFELSPVGSTVSGAKPTQDNAAAKPTSTASAPTLSILEFKIDENSKLQGITGMDLALYMETYLSQEGKYSLSNRLALNEVISEKEIQNTDLFNSKFASKLGGFAETDNILVGQVKRIGEGYSVFVKMIDVRTNIQSMVFERGDLYVSSGGLNVFKNALKSISEEISRSRK